MNISKLLVDATNTEIEAVALAYFARMCEARSTHGSVKKAARDEYAALARKVRAILDLRGDKDNGN